MRFAILIAVFVTLSNCMASAATPSDRPLAVSPRELLANPDKYLNKEVVVRGFARVQFEDVNIYSIARGRLDTKSCVSLLLEKQLFPNYHKRFNNKMVSVSGTFTAPACPEGSICSWICNDKYGISVRRISF